MPLPSQNKTKSHTIQVSIVCISLTFWSPNFQSFKLPLQNLMMFLGQHFKFYISTTNRFQRPKNHVIRIITAMTPLLVPISCIACVSCWCNENQLKRGKSLLRIKVEGKSSESRESLWQACETDGHVAYTAGKQRTMSGYAQLAFSFWCGLKHPDMEQCCFY